MNRKDFIKSLALLPFAMKLQSLQAISDTLKESPLMPTLFLGHGSPMNAIEENEFVAAFRKLGKNLPQPQAILCISAHWETRGSYLTAMAQPKTIHDFGGFPPALYREQYPAPGQPQLAQALQQELPEWKLGLDTEHWGLDHGAWTVLKHLYPKANVPVIQLSLNRNLQAAQHYALGQSLRKLRRRGVLIVGSGNLVHNLGLVAWDKLNQVDYAFDWAREAQASMNKFILDGDHQSLINFQKQGKAWQLAIPTPEHYLPLLYTLSLQEKNEKISLFNDKALGGSLNMTSVKIGL